MPLYELLQFKWDDLITIHNVPYLVRSFVDPLNFKGMILATLQRVKLFSVAPVVIVEPDYSARFTHIELVSASAYTTVHCNTLQVSPAVH